MRHIMAGRPVAFYSTAFRCIPLGDEERRKMTCMKRSDSDRLLGSRTPVCIDHCPLLLCPLLPGQAPETSSADAAKAIYLSTDDPWMPLLSLVESAMPVRAGLPTNGDGVQAIASSLRRRPPFTPPRAMLNQ
jgi:hypothetical protein